MVQNSICMFCEGGKVCYLHYVLFHVLLINGSEVYISVKKKALNSFMNQQETYKNGCLPHILPFNSKMILLFYEN